MLLPEILTINATQRDRFRSKTIGVLMGGMSAERDVSLRTGAAIAAALTRRGYRVETIDVNRELAVEVRRRQIDVAWIALHGSPGEDGTVQGLLELQAVPYTGSGVLASALAIDKIATKKMLQAAGLPTPPFCSLTTETDCALEPPLVVKPADAGSTIGISLVRCAADLAAAIMRARRYAQTILCERFIDGRELTAAVLLGRPLPLVEIEPAEGFYDYRAKYTAGATRYQVAPELPPDTTAHLQQLAVDACVALGCRGAARVDIMLDRSNTPFILEINTIPGMTETSLLPMAAQHAGIAFDDLVELILLAATCDSHPSKEHS